MAESGRCFLVILLFATVLLPFSGCGGGGSEGISSGEQFPEKILSWQPPTKFLDNTPLEPSKDLANFEIYIKGSGGFTENDSPMALVSAVDSGTGQLNTAFNLANLGAYLSRGVVYQVALRAVAITGAKSAFSPPATFSF
jgi:hypothetical protein